jgi:hypothetical protein
MSAHEVSEAVQAAISAVAGPLGAPFDCTTIDDEEAGQVTVVCNDGRGGDLPAVLSFTIDMDKYRTFDEVRAAALDRLCAYILNERQ